MLNLHEILISFLVSRDLQAAISDLHNLSLESNIGDKFDYDIGPVRALFSQERLNTSVTTYWEYQPGKASCGAKKGWTYILQKTLERH